MAIINFTFEHDRAEYAEGAYCPLDRHGSEKGIILWRTYEGACVADREMNGSWDSDFYMTVYEAETGEFREIMYATTRGWSYPAMGSFVDATDEVKALYAAHLAERARRSRVLSAWRRRKEDIADAALMGISRAEVRKLRGIYSDENYARVRGLLRVKNFRSNFRANLAKHVREWLSTAAPKYPTPLSRRQLECLR